MRRLAIRERLTLSWLLLAAAALEPIVGWTLDRRTFVAASLGAPFAAQASCQGGALAPEQAVPGAYQQACMELETRRIPIDNTSSLVIHQEASGPGSTGMAVWNSSLLLLRLLQRIVEREPEFLRERTALELGCGPGLVSLALKKWGASRVWATDGNPRVVELAAKNARANGLDEVVRCEVLQWGLLDASEYSASLVVGSDLTYNSGNWRALAETMSTIANDYVLYLSLGHAGFDVNAEVEGFLTVARDQGLIPVAGPNDSHWPFATISMSLTDLLLQDCVRPEERSILQATGGARVLLLRKKVT